MNRQPAGVPTGGQFTPGSKGRSSVALQREHGGAGLISAADRSRLESLAGVLRSGHDGDDISDVLDRIEGADMRCLWGEVDEGVYGGDSQLIGRATGGQWYEISPELLEYLSGTGQALPADARYLDGERTCDASFDPHTGKNVAHSAIERCSECEDSLDDNEGYDGLCGNCADQAESEGRWD